MKSGIKVNHYLQFIGILLILPLQSFAVPTTYLRIGETMVLKFPSNSKFVLSNKRLISASPRPSEHQIIVKAKAAGHASISIFPPGKAVQKWPFFIAENTSLKTMANIMSELQALNFSFELSGRKKIQLTKPIEKLSRYQELTSILNKVPPQISISGKISTALQFHILQKIYLHFLEEEINSFACDFQELWVLCHANKNEKGIDQVIDYLSHFYPIKMTKIRKLSTQRNLQLKVKIIQIETFKNKDRQTGPNEIQLDLVNLIKNNFDQIIANKSIHLQDLNSKVSLLAEPNFKITLGKKTNIRIGSEVRYLTPAQDGASNESWKFFGIDLAFTVNKFGANFEADYSFHFSSPPQSGQTNLNSSQSTALLQLNAPEELFEFKIDLKKEGMSNVPWINRIPLIGLLFQSQNDSVTHKKVIALAKLEEEK